MNVLEQQNSHLKSILETADVMEHEYNDKIQTTLDQYDIAQQQFHTLKNKHQQTDRDLLSIQAKQKNVI